MNTAKVFTNGRSQAVRLPKECRFQDSDVYVKKYEDIVILIPKSSPWKSLIVGLEGFSDDFPAGRNQPVIQARDEIQ